MTLGKKRKKPESKGRIRSSSGVAVRSGSSSPASDQPLQQVETPGWLSWFFILVASLPVLISPLGQTRFGYWPDLHMAAGFQLGMVALCCLYFLVVRRGAIELKLGAMGIPLTLFVAWALISIGWASNKYMAALSAANWVAALLAYFALLNLMNEQRIRILLLAIYLIGLIVALIGISQHLFQDTWVIQSAKPGSLFVNKNIAAQYIVLTLPLGYALFLWKSERSKYWFFGIASAVMTCFLAYTKTRGAWLGFLLAVILLLLPHFKVELRHLLRFDSGKRKAFIASACLLLLMLNLSSEGLGWRFNEYYGRLASITEQGEDGEFVGSGGTRLIMWKNTFEIFKDNPIMGVGIGNSPVHYNAYFNAGARDKRFEERKIGFSRATHNDYIQTIAELGLIGVGLFVFLVYKGFQTLRAAIASDSVNKPLHIAIAAATGGLLVIANFSFPLQLPTSTFLVMLYLGVASAALLTVEPHSDSSVISRPRSSTLLLSGFLVLGVFASFAHMKMFEAEVHFRKLKFMSKKSMFKEASAEGLLAISANPYRRYSHTLTSYAYYKQGDLEKAIEFAKESLRLYPAQMDTMGNLITYYQKNKQPEEAKAVFKELIELDPERKEIHAKRFRFKLDD